MRYPTIAVDWVNETYDLWTTGEECLEVCISGWPGSSKHKDIYECICDRQLLIEHISPLSLDIICSS